MAEIPEKIISECAIAFPSNSDDCNKYVKAVSGVFFEPDLFTGPNMNADAIIDEIGSNNDWTSLGKSHMKAISNAKAGKFVIAGMKSTELSANHGHLAIIIGRDGKPSGTVTVPLCYSGSLNPAARVQKKRVSETFPASMARKKKISYFAREVDTVPAANAVDRLTDFMSGIQVEPELMSTKTARIRKAKPSVKKTKRKVRSKSAKS